MLLSGSDAWTPNKKQDSPMVYDFNDFGYYAETTEEDKIITCFPGLCFEMSAAWEWKEKVFFNPGLSGSV